jgi:hypothetical protein
MELRMDIQDLRRGKITVATVRHDFDNTSEKYTEKFLCEIPGTEKPRKMTLVGQSHLRNPQAAENGFMLLSCDCIIKFFLTCWASSTLQRIE